jgi:broad specificity phosphatase PhoE
MAVIYLIRHGQASFGSKDYDCLSELGRRQAALVGAALERAAGPFDALISGTLLRQQDTAREIAAALGSRAPQLETRAAFDEYDHVAIVRAYLPLFMAQVGAPRGVDEAEVMSNQKLFELAFRFMIKSWMDRAPHRHEGLEPWPSFCARVSGGLEYLLASHDPKARLAIVTSGGPIAAALRAVLGLSNKRTLSMNWSIYNASLTQLYYGRSSRHDDALLLGFNNVAHLEESGGRDLISFR